MLTTPDFLTLVTFCGIIISISISLFFLREAIKFNRLIALFKRAQHTTDSLSGLARMKRITSWFEASASCVFLYAVGYVVLGFLGNRLYVPSIWTAFFSFVVVARWLTSFSQIMMCFTESQNNSETSVHPHVATQDSDGGSMVTSSSLEIS